MWVWMVNQLIESSPVPADQAPFHMINCYEDAALLERMNAIPMTLLMKFRRE